MPVSSRPFTILIRVQHDIANAMDINQAVLLVLLNMSAAWVTPSKQTLHITQSSWSKGQPIEMVPLIPK